jgi:hypothetical protein
VTAKSHGQYGTWEVEVAGTTDITAGGAISIASTGGDVSVGSTAGRVTITSPTKICLIAPEVEQVVASSFYTATSAALEFFGSKNAVGIHQFNATGVNMSVDGFKSERVGMVSSLVGVKFELVGFQNQHQATDISVAASKLESAATWLGKSAVRLYNAAMVKMG